MTPQLGRKLSCQYNRALQPSALRDAILGYIGYSFPGGVFRIKCDDYLPRAKRTPGRKLIVPPRVEESDIFASFFLCGSLPRARESIRHYDGCIKLYRYLLYRPNVAPFFKVYGRFALDQATQWLNRELVLGTGISPRLAQIVLPSFQQICEDYSHLSSPKWPSLDMAALDILLRDTLFGMCVYDYIVSVCDVLRLAGRTLVLYVPFSHGVVTSFQQIHRKGHLTIFILQFQPYFSSRIQIVYRDKLRVI